MLEGKRVGPGTWVNASGTERLQGIWTNDLFCAGKGRKEYADGTVQEGKFIKGVYQSDVSH
jgi:hypothetical protein